MFILEDHSGLYSRRREGFGLDLDDSGNGVRGRWRFRGRGCIVEDW